ncbi:hypothetical protein F5146DRAFT_312801 [Armillaria mellea]|nr:hypothetical protein F5146DRAFT_312801 [Armillaria mellea]
MQFPRMTVMDQQRFDPAKKTISPPENQRGGKVLDEVVDLPLRKTKSTTDILDSQRFDPAKKASQQQDDSRSILPDSLNELLLNDEFTIIDPLEAQPPATPTADATVVRKTISRVLSLDKVLPFRPSPALSIASSSRLSTSASTAMSSILSIEYPIESQCDDIRPDSYIATKMIIPRSPSILSFDALSCYSRNAFESEVDAEVKRINENKNISVWVNQASSSTDEYRDLWRCSVQPTPSILQVESRVEAV